MLEIAARQMLKQGQGGRIINITRYMNIHRCRMPAPTQPLNMRRRVNQSNGAGVGQA